MKKTENYAMPYPEQDDYFNVEDFQNMMVSVDNLMKKLSDSGAQISSDAEHLYNQTKAQMDNIQKRMNAFTALRDGSTTGDAELKDIRVAYDGKEYGNAGEAVREQASDIHKALFGAGASIWSKAKSESTKYVAETKGICILNERFTAAGVVAKISRGAFAQNESTLNLDRECSAYIVEFEKNPGTVYMPSAETIKIVSTTKIIFEANGNARCWIPVEKGQYFAVDSTATAYTSESNHVPYMLYDQTNKTLECQGFGSAGSIEPVDPYSLALEYKLEYDMDDTGLVKQIDANREAADSLKEDLADIATFVKLTDLVKDKPFGYCNGVDDKSFVGNTLSGTFASGNFVEIGAVSDTYLKAGKKYRVAYKTISGSGCVIRTMSDYSFKKLIITVGGAYPLDGFVDVDIITDSNICISNGNGVINCELYVYDITDISEDELSLIDWENPIHNISVGIVSNAIEAEHSKTSDKALVADRVLSVDVNGLVNYSSRNLLDVNNCSVGLLSRGIVGENNGYITSNFMPVNDFVAYCNEGKTDIPINAIAFYTDAKENSYIPDSQITVWSGAPSGYAKSDMPDDAKYFRVSVYKDYITGSAYKYQMFEKGTAKTHWQAYFNSYKSSENQVLFDKVIDTLGDSITEQRTWQGYVADALHTGVIYNHGIGGTRISGNDSNAMWQDSRINALNDDIDCLLIMGGTNDGAQGVTIGDMSRDNVNTDTFVGAYNVLLSKVFYKYYRLGSGYSGITQISEVNPIQIMIATPIYCNDSNYGNMDEIAEAVRGVANLWSIPVADQHAKSGINSATSSIYLSDNVHPNDEGGKKVANVWVNALKSNAELIN